MTTDNSPESNLPLSPLEEDIVAHNIATIPDPRLVGERLDEYVTVGREVFDKFRALATVCGFPVDAKGASNFPMTVYRAVKVLNRPVACRKAQGAVELRAVYVQPAVDRYLSEDQGGSAEIIALYEHAVDEGVENPGEVRLHAGNSELIAVRRWNIERSPAESSVDELNKFSELLDQTLASAYSQQA